MRAAVTSGGIAGALLVAVLAVGAGPAGAGSPRPDADPSPVTSTAAAASSQAPASPAESPRPIISPVVSLGAGPSSPPAPAQTSPAAPTARTSALPSRTGASRARSTPSAVRTTAAAGTVSSRPVTSTQNSAPVYTAPVGGPAPTDFAAVDGGDSPAATSLSPDSNGRPTPVVVAKTARTTKKIGRFSITDLLLVLILVAGGVAIAGAGGLWATRR